MIFSLMSGSLFVDDRRGRIGAHAARVRTLVAVEDALVVLGGRKEHGVLSVHHREDRALLAMKELLDQHLGAGRAELIADKHVVDRRLGLFLRLGDNDALPRGKSVRLDDDGESVPGKRGFGLCGVRKGLGLAGRDARRIHDLLREPLRALHARARGNGTERGNALLLKGVDKTDHERSLGSDHDEIGLLGLRPGDDTRDVIRLQRDIRRHIARAGVPRCAENRMLLGILRQPPCNRMLAPT